MHDRHTNKQRYFNEQVYTTDKYVLPFVEKKMAFSEDTHVLEIGCGEGGNLVPFLKRGCQCVGVDLSEPKLTLGKEWLAAVKNGKNVKLICQDIYDVDDFGVKFDLIIMRDVIEHIHDQEKFMAYLKKFLAPQGYVFFGFPPWQNPFGGHQQMCKSKVLSKLPYFHLLPTSIYRFILKTFGESELKIKGMSEVKETGISIERFQRILKKENYQIDLRTPYLFNPNYEIKFKLKPKRQSSLLFAIPFFRNFITTACYYLVSQKNSSSI